MNAVKLPKYQTEVLAFCERVDEAFHPNCVVSHGSLPLARPGAGRSLGTGWQLFQ